ncbi:hypothetical protein ABB02_00524 [Clostridiaceae bacterium JG1575]|nr:hypothetical protein ABB02_00524 [Clostridiaceae bacterium JG1575]
MLVTLSTTWNPIPMGSATLACVMADAMLPAMSPKIVLSSSWVPIKAWSESVATFLSTVFPSPSASRAMVQMVDLCPFAKPASAMVEFPWLMNLSVAVFQEFPPL